MQFGGTFFPGVSTPDRETQSQRSYSYDPMGSLTVQSSHFSEIIGQAADNITDMRPEKTFRDGGQGSDGRRPQMWEEGFLGNVELIKPGWFPRVGWFGAAGVGGINNNWDDLRQVGVGYGLYAPHLPMYPVPAGKLYEPGSGFVVPATFLGQPLVAMAKPPGA
jgi:hypothetical protein